MAYRQSLALLIYLSMFAEGDDLERQKMIDVLVFRLGAMIRKFDRSRTGLWPWRRLCATAKAAHDKRRNATLQRIREWIGANYFPVFFRVLRLLLACRFRCPQLRRRCTVGAIRSRRWHVDKAGLGDEASEDPSRPTMAPGSSWAMVKRLCF
jgi:hypothetical protein